MDEETGTDPYGDRVNASAGWLAPPGIASRAADLWHRFAPGVLAAVVVIAAVVGYRDWERPDVVLMAVASAAAALVARRVLWPVLVAGAVGWLWLGLWPAVAVAAYYCGVSLRNRRHLTVFLVAAAGMVAVPALVMALPDGSRQQVGAGNALAFVAMFVLLPSLLGMWVAARRQVGTALRQRAEDRKRERAALIERERAQERADIAREMHDVVAHRVSLMVLHAGALEVGNADERTRATAELIRNLGRDALGELRDVLRVLRSTDADGTVQLAPPPGMGDLDGLLDQSRRAGLAVVRHDEGMNGPLPPAVGTAVYRVVQESLTNVHRHAGDRPTEVFLRQVDDHVEVEVVNAPPPAPSPPRPTATEGSGLGLVGLGERVSLLGGHLDAGPCPDGRFAVRARIPLPRAVQPA
jgi:signal transduction histidine kinase